jgi:hypothetical protein
MPSIDTTLEQEARARENSQIGSDTSRFMPRTDYTASVFSAEKYNVKGLSYPQNVMDTDEYGYNRVVFYINVSTDSRVLRAPGGSAEVVEGVQRDFRPEIVGKGYTVGQIAGGSAIVGGLTGAVAAGAANASSGIGGALGSATSGGIKGAAVGGAYALGAGALVSSNMNNQESDPAKEKEPVFSRPQKRLKAAIALYVPNQLSVRYSAGWGDEDTAGFAMAGEAGKVGGELLRAMSGSVTKTGALLKDVLGSLVIDKAPLGGSMGIAAGLASNPKKEQSFKNVDFRTFSFDYQFSPKSEAEAQNVLNIIRAFKYHMHPEFKNETGFLYLYPSEFDIVYYKGTKENLNLHRHTSCVLTEMNINYSPNGVFSTFPNGMPTQISVTLTFRELMLLTKEAIERYA